MALETLKQIDPGTGLTLEDLIDAFITSPREAESLKRYLARDKKKEQEGKANEKSRR